MQNLRCLIALAAVVALIPLRAQAQNGMEPHSYPAPEKLGKVDFPASCKPGLQPAFTRAVALLHSFAYVSAEMAFAEVATEDPACGMAQWGIAMSNFHTIWAPPTEAEFAAGLAASRKATQLSAPTDRERDFIAAIAAYYQGEGVSHPARVAAYEKAMAKVAARYPKDREAAIFHALAILGVAYNSPPEKSYAKQKQVAAILNPLLPLEPDHPGISHYVIHSFDYPDLAELALPAARVYAKIAPSAPHALHMPSHIFTRLGMWKESIDSNLASAAAAQKGIVRSHPGATAFDALHASDYLAYAYLQIGQDAKALELAEQVHKVASLDLPQFSAGYALAAIPARHALERGAWKEAAKLTVRPEFYPWAKYPYTEAIVHYARTVGAARSGDVESARAALERLTTIQAGLKGQKGFDWWSQVEIQRLAAAGWVARAEKKDDEAVRLLRAAADLEDATDKHPVTPGSILPAREQLADLLTDLGKPAEALVEYEASLRMAPARYNSYAGAARAAERAGEKNKAKDFSDRLLALSGGTLPTREPGGNTAAGE
jgi:tetratricopeptide (TPR) repeat protein